MNIIFSSKLFLILITQAIHGLEQIQDINEGSSTYACKGCDKNMHWDDCEEENKIREWYFNTKIICHSSPEDGFTVSPPYQGRIERKGKTGIKLKNVTLDDEGNYIMSSRQKLSTYQNMKEITLRILEPPTENCTCNWGQPPDFRCELPQLYCGRPKVSLVCKRKQTYEVLKELQKMNSTVHKEEILCCLEGEAMKCVTDTRRFCTILSTPYQDMERSSEDGKTQTTGSVPVPVPVFRDKDHGLNGSQQFRPIDWAILALLIIILLIIIVMGFCLVFLIINSRKRKKKMDADTKLHSEESMPLNQTMSDSDFEFELQRRLNIRLHSRHGTGAGPMPKPQNNSDTASEFQKHDETTPNPKFGKTEMHTEEQQSGNYEKDTVSGFHCKKCFVKKRGVLFLPCAHIVTCAECSRDLIQCPDCKTDIETKKTMCLDTYQSKKKTNYLYA